MRSGPICVLSAVLLSLCGNVLLWASLDWPLPKSHLNELHPRCGKLKFRYTLLSPGFCPFCLGNYDERFQQWLAKAIHLNHIDQHFNALITSTAFCCPHPSCQTNYYVDITNLRHRFFDAYSIEEPRPNCVSRKRKRQAEPELFPKDHTQAHSEAS